MKQLKKLSVFFLTAALILGTLLIPVQALAEGVPEMKEHNLTLQEGKSKTLTMKNCKGLKVTFRSNDKSIATVSKKGKVTAKKVGKTSIRVTVDKKWYFSCTVTVEEKPVAEKTATQAVQADKQCQIWVYKTVKDTPVDIKISTESDNENLKLDICEATSSNKGVAVGTIDQTTKEVTISSKKMVFIINETGEPVDVTIEIKTQDGKKTVSSVKFVET